MKPGKVNGAERDPPGHSMEPARQRVGIMDRARPAGQQQERHLERILGQVAVGQQLATDAQHQGTVASDQLGESGFIVAGGEIVEQLPVGSVGSRRTTGQLLDLTNQSA